MCSTRVGKLFQDSPDVCEWGRSLALTFRKFGTFSYEKKVLPVANFFSNSVGDEGKKKFYNAATLCQGIHRLLSKRYFYLPNF